MDPDEIKFYLILYLIYLSDCFILPKSSALMLYSRFRGMKARIKSTRNAGVFAGRFWLLRPLFPPIGESRVLEFTRGSFGVKGYCSISPIGESAADGERARYIAYDDIDTIEVRDLILWINGEKWFSGSHKLYELKNRIEAIVKSPDRSVAIQQMLESSFAAGREAGDTLAILLKRSEWLNFFCSLYAIILLLFLPFSLFHLPVQRMLWGFAVPTVVLHVICCAVYLIVHKKLLPDEKGHRWEHFFKMFLCPPMLIRACDVIDDRVGIDGDAVAAMMSCSNETMWLPEIGKIWRRLIPCCYERYSTDISEAILGYGEQYRIALKQELESRGIATDSLELDAAAVDAGHKFCPRCEAQFRGDMTECNDCGGVALLAGEGE
jgi:hypothetical protein